MAWKPSRVHLLGVAATVAVAIVLLLTVIPWAARDLFSPSLRGFGGLRAEPFYYLAVALIPVVLWLVPAFVRWLARTTYGAHKALFGRSGFYVRFPVERPFRFRTTVLMCLGPFAVDMLAIVEIEYFFGNLTQIANPRGFFVAPALLLLAGFLTALIPGAWLVDTLDIRLVNPKRGEVTRAAALFEGVLGPLGTVALLVSFITTLHEANYSYEQGLFVLGVWAVRLFPPILAAVSVFRVVVEPNVLPSLKTWCDRSGIPVRTDLSAALENVRTQPAERSTPPGDGPAPSGRSADDAGP